MLSCICPGQTEALDTQPNGAQALEMSSTVQAINGWQNWIWLAKPFQRGFLKEIQKFIFNMTKNNVGDKISISSNKYFWNVNYFYDKINESNLI